MRPKTRTEPTNPLHPAFSPFNSLYYISMSSLAIPAKHGLSLSVVSALRLRNAQLRMAPIYLSTL